MQIDDRPEQHVFELRAKTRVDFNLKEGALIIIKVCRTTINAVPVIGQFQHNIQCQSCRTKGMCTLWISTKPTLTVYSASLLELMRWKMLSMTFGMTPWVLPPGVNALPMVYVLPDPVCPYANTARTALLAWLCVRKFVVNILQGWRVHLTDCMILGMQMVMQLPIMKTGWKACVKLLAACMAPMHAYTRRMLACTQLRVNLPLLPVALYPLKRPLTSGSTQLPYSRSGDVLSAPKT